MLFVQYTLGCIIVSNDKQTNKQILIHKHTHKHTYTRVKHMISVFFEMRIIRKWGGGRNESYKPYMHNTSQWPQGDFSSKSVNTLESYAERLLIHGIE